MQPARIAELLRPFLSDRCHSESGRRRGGEPAVVLSSAQLDHISTYIDILLRWNSRINLTAIRDPEEIVARHFGESFFVARHLFPTGSDLRISPEQAPASPEEHREGHDLSRAGKELKKDGALAPEVNNVRLADLGSGAGFPGIPIKIWAPEITLTLIESNHKKATFLREVVRALILTNVDIQNARAENVSTTFDVVTLRAVERFEAQPWQKPDR